MRLDAGKNGSTNLVPVFGPGPANPCSSTSGDLVGAAYLGFAGNNPDPAGSASSPSPVAPGQGVGVQG